MEPKPRTFSPCPDIGMESIYLKIIGIENDLDQIEVQRNIAREENVDFLVHLREVSEEVQLYCSLGIVKVNK